VRKHMKQRLGAIFLSIGCIIAGAGSALAQATVTTDQSDYPPGATVNITGTGFWPGETIQLQVLRIDIPENSGPEHLPWMVTNDASGNFQTTWYVTPDEAGATLRLTATGLTSGLTAQTTFTDSAISSTASGGNWNSASTWARVLRTGTITTSSSSTAVTGSGTTFTTQLAAGSIITTTGGTTIGTVASITDNTHLTLTANAASSNSGISYQAQVVPFSGDDVTIVAGATVTVTADATVNSIAFGNSSSSAATLTVNNGVTLTVSGDVALQTSASRNTSATIAGAGTISCASVTVSGSPGGNYVSTLTSTISILDVSGDVSLTGNRSGNSHDDAEFDLNSGSMTVGGTITLDSNTGHGAQATFDMSQGAATGTLTLSGTTPFSSVGANSTFTANGSGATVNYSASGAQTVFATTYQNLVFSGSGAKSMASGTTVSGNLSIAPTGSATASVGNGLSLNVGSLTLGGVTQVSGTWGSTASSATHKNSTYFGTTATGVLNVLTGAATRLVITGSGSQTAGASQNLTITAKDASGNTDLTYAGSKNLTLSGAISSGNPVTAPTVKNSSGTAIAFGSATAINFSSGVATVSGGNNGVMTLYKAESATISATDGSISSSGSDRLSVTVSAGTASKLVITGSGSQTAGASQNLTTTAEDAYGNTATTYTGSKNLTLSGANSSGNPVTAPTVKNSSGTAVAFGSATAITFGSGVATVSGGNNGVMTLYKAESATISVTDGSISSSGSDRLSVTVSAGTANKLAFTMQPGGGTGGTAWSQQPVVTVQDQYGNTVTTDTSTVTVAIQNNAGPGGTLSGTLTKAAVSGVADFSLNASKLSINKIGTGYTLRATDGSLTFIDSSGFNITVGAAAKLAFTTQPGGGTGGTAWSQQPVVTVQDAGGNTVTTDTSTVTVAIQNNAGPGGVLSGTLTKAAVSGVADFSLNASKLSIDKIGTGYTLRATDGSLTFIDSSGFNITVGAANAYRITANTTTPGAGASDQLTITLVDAGANTVTTFSGDKTLTFSGLATAGDGTYPTVTDKNGAAVNLGTSEATTFASGVSSSANGAAVLTAYKAQTATLNVLDSGGLASTSPGGAGVSLTIANVNPVALAKSFTRAPGLSLKMLKSALLSGATDANHDSLTVSAVQNPSTGGATVTAPAGSWVFYLPNSAGNGDTFTYTVNDGNGGTDTKTVTIYLQQQGGAAQQISYNAGGVTIIFAGIPNYTYDVQRSADAGFTSPTVMTTTQAPSAGVFTYIDSNPPNPGPSFYRLMQH
jgi:hypothetical protein